MHKKVLVALDQGTTSSRAVVFDLQGHILSQYAPVSSVREFKMLSAKV